MCTAELRISRFLILFFFFIARKFIKRNVSKRKAMQKGRLNAFEMVHGDDNMKDESKFFLISCINYERRRMEETRECINIIRLALGKINL